MRKLHFLSALLLMVASVQTTLAQGFRVYKSDGTVAQFSLRTDSIVFYDGIGTDTDFGPFTPVNQCIAGTWYRSKTETMTFSEDGSTDYIAGSTYEFMPYQGTIIIYGASGTPVSIVKVYKVTAEQLIVSELGSNSFSTWSSTPPAQQVTGITLSATSITLRPDETLTLTATVLPADADNKTVTWESSNEDVAEVNRNGRIIANAAGTCVITCTATDGSGVKAECQVSVEDGAETFTVNGVSFQMIAVEGGIFQMGSTTGRDNEKPVHEVRLSSFSIGQTEVTQELWEAVMGSNPSNFKGNKLPVERVSWNDCQTFITKLNQLTGKTFRLPTEAEWEFAARGGTQSKGYTYSGSDTLEDVAWYYDNSGKKTHEVATKAPNELGIYDMSGNVREWCQDWYGSDYYASSVINNPTGPTSGSSRVCRGCSWGGAAARCRVAYRFDYTPTFTNDYIGFRLAL